MSKWKKIEERVEALEGKLRSTTSTEPVDGEENAEADELRERVKELEERISIIDKNLSESIAKGERNRKARERRVEKKQKDGDANREKGSTLKDIK